MTLSYILYWSSGFFPQRIVSRRVLPLSSWKGLCQHESNRYRKLMRAGRQVDFVLPAPETDGDGYLTWDTEYWTTVDNKRFIRTYSLNGRVLRDSTTHNIYDLENDFKPEKAAQIRIS